MTAPLRGRVVTPAELNDDERRLWRELCTQPALDHPFYSLTFTECVARVHPGARICILERGGEIEGFLPFQFSSKWTRALRAAEQIGDGMSDYFGIIARPGLRVTPKELLTAAGLDALPFHHLPEEQAVFGLTGVQPRAGLRIKFGDNAADYWRGLKAANSDFVGQTERRQRKLVQTYGPLRFNLSVIGSAHKIEELIATKREQYRLTGTGDALAAAWKCTLLFTLARCQESDCAGVFSELHAGNTWVAAHFGLRNERVLHYWFPVYNSALAKLSPGHVLMRHMIEGGVAHGIRIVDLGEGEQQHKTLWRPSSYSLQRGFWFRRSARALTYRTGLAASWRLRDRSRPTDARSDRPEKQPKGK